MSFREWIVNNIEKEKIMECAKNWQVPPLTAAILYSRRFREKQEVLGFLNGFKETESPFDITDMEKIVERVNTAIDSHQKICVYGDYDADGVTATALVYSYLKSRGADVTYYIPSRYKDGYGLNVGAIDKLKEKNVDLIFTVDNGVSAFDEVEYASSLGIDVVITDHHRVPDKIPNATAVVDPYRKECADLKHKNFAGVGVAFKVIQAFETGTKNLSVLLDKYSDLVALGTIGDSIELIGETREVVKHGLKNIANSKRPGVKALLECSNLMGRVLDSSGVAFGLVPRINVSGRMGDAELALRLLLSEDDEEARTLCAELDGLNALRKNTENEILESVEKTLNNEPWRKHEKIIVVEGENWNHGVLGIVASRVTQKYGKPSILITIDGEEAKGSCRSVEGFSIYELLCLCAEHLQKFGGHPMAAGISLKTEDIENFRKSVIENSKKFEIPFQKLVIDLNLKPDMISEKLLPQLDMLKPFGSGNPEPVFGFFGMTLKKIRPIGQGKHLRLTFERDGSNLEMLYFGKSAYDFLYYEGEVLDIAATLNKNEYRNIISVSVKIVDVRLSNLDFKSILEHKSIYEKFKSEDNLSSDEIDSLTPTHEDFASIYRYMRLIGDKPVRVDLLSERLFKGNKNTAKIFTALDVMEERGLADIHRSGDEYKINVKNINGKIKLSESYILTSIKNKKGET